MPAPPNTDPTTAIALVSGTTISQQVYDAGVTYIVYYKYTNASAVDEVISIGMWGDLGGGGTYHPDPDVFIDEDLNTVVVNSYPDGSFTVPIPAGATYWFEVRKNFGNFNPSNLNIKTLVGPAGASVAGDIFVNSASIDQAQIDAGLTGLHAGFIRTEDSAIIGFVPQFVTGEAGDTLDDGTLLYADEGGSYDGQPPPNPTAGYWLYLYDGTDFSIITRVALESNLTPPLIRTHLPSQTFYVLGKNSGGNCEYATVAADGTFTSLGTLTSSGGVSAIAVDAAEVHLYLGMRNFNGTNYNTRVRRWNMNTLSYDSDLFISAAGTFSTRHAVTDILVLEDDTVIVGLFRSSDLTMEVRRYDNAGTLLHTYTFTFASGLQFIEPRLGYSSDADAFWLFNHLNTGYSDIRKVHVDGTELVASLTPDVEQSDDPQADPPLPYTSNSCPIVELRASQLVEEEDAVGVIGPLVWVHWPRVVP